MQGEIFSEKLSKLLCNPCAPGLRVRAFFPVLHNMIDSYISLNVQIRVAENRHQKDNFERANDEENVTKMKGTGRKNTCKKQVEAAWRGLGSRSPAL